MDAPKEGEGSPQYKNGLMFIDEGKPLWDALFEDKAQEGFNHFLSTLWTKCRYSKLQAGASRFNYDISTGVSILGPIHPSYALGPFKSKGADATGLIERSFFTSAQEGAQAAQEESDEEEDEDEEDRIGNVRAFLGYLRQWADEMRTNEEEYVLECPM